MKKKVDKIIKHIILENLNKKIFFISKVPTIIEYIKNKYSSKYSSKINFFTIEEFFEIISGLKILDNHSTLLYFFSILKKNDFIEKNFHDFFNWGPKILNDFQNIDFNMVNVEYFFSSIISREKINKWNLNLLEQEKNFFWEKIHKYYYLLQSQLFKKGIAYHGMLFKTAISRLDSFLYQNFNIKIVLFLVDSIVFNECEKIFTKKIFQKGLVYDLCKENISILNPVLLNKKIIPNSKKYLQLQYDNLKIIGVSKEIEQVKTVEDIICKFIKKNKKPNKILLIPGDNSLTIPLIHSIKKKLGINVSFNINFPLNDIPIYYTFYSIFQLLLKKDKFKKFTRKDVIRVLSNGYIQKFFLKKNLILKKFYIENDSDFICEDTIKKYLYRNDLWIIFKIPTNNIKIILISIISFIRKFIKLLFTKKRKHFLELKFIFKLETYIQKLRIIIRKTKNLSIGINDIFNIYEEFTHTENIRYIHRNIRGLYVTGFIDIFFENFDVVIITSFNEGVIPPSYKKNSFIPFDIYQKLKINNTNENFYFHHLTRIIKFSKKTYLIYKDQPDEINSGEKSRFIHRIEISSKISTEKINKPFFPINSKRQPIIINKTKSIIQRLDELIDKGLSPSSIHLYNYNPLLFYYKKILKLNPPEETSYKKKIGKIIHQILKILYDPIKENFITIDFIHKMKKNYEYTIKKVLLGKKEIIEGNNMFFYYVIKNYIENFISWDEKFVINGHKIFIKEIERKVSATLNIGARKINLHGIIDRIDEFDGTTRILDYKIGFSKMKEINIYLKNMENIFYDINHAKTMQLLIYIYLWFKSSTFKGCQKKPPIIGIVSPKMNGSIFQIPINIFHIQKIQKTNITYLDYKMNVLPFLIKRISDILDHRIPIVEKIY
ncbi:PD-(D/E)XK nuclease family protein [Blattabacterium cuenoti]|uniref:PD-(D/E)XK nuclease family protein n=1 Tax=Blattabacterium cuenoti TaxID=1653831 RepID=UPI00163BDB79|nr:PD-(D/E)XK nuclease family protein [Blattabacterium cuenoti]